MKKLLLIFTCGFLFLSISGNAQKNGAMSDKAKKNLAAMHGISKCFDTKDFTKLGNYIAENGVDHAGETGDINGLANMKKEFEKTVSGYENSKTEVIKELADDEYVMSWMRFTGTMKTDQMGMKAGDKFDMTSIEVAKFKNGKAVEHWTFMQPSDLMKMLPQSAPQ